MPVRKSLLHHAHCRSAQDRKRRDSRNALSARRDPRVEHALQVDAELGCILGQPLHATPCVVGLLPSQTLRPSRHGVWAEAVLISCSEDNLALISLTRFPGLALNVSALHKSWRDCSEATLFRGRLRAGRSVENDPMYGPAVCCKRTYTESLKL